jgi:integrase
MAAVGRLRTKHKNLPPRMHLKRGRYYYGRKDEFLGENLADAMLAYGEREAARAGRRPRTWGDLADQFAAKVIPHKAERTREDYTEDLAMLRRVFDKAPLEHIEPAHISGYRDSRFRKTPKGRKPPREPILAKTRANREIALFSAVWNWGRDTGRTALPNPCEGVRRHKETGRDRYVTDDEFAAVYAEADAVLRVALDLYLLTGQRVGDVLRMSLTDLRDGCLHLRQRKTGKPLRLVIEGELAGVVERIKGQTFPANAVVTFAMVRDEAGQRITYDALSDRFQAARTRAGVHFQLRDLRAKAATDLDDLALAQRLLGHSSRAMTEHYTKQRIGERVSPLLRTRREIADKKNGSD